MATRSAARSRAWASSATPWRRSRFRDPRRPWRRSARACARRAAYLRPRVAPRRLQASPCSWSERACRASDELNIPSRRPT
jgi:hypothetical protein